MPTADFNERFGLHNLLGGHGSARRANSTSPFGVALGFGLVEGLSKDEVPIGFGVEVGKGDSSSVP